ncbi:DNA-3-methyladenine glycosylase family protein [Idiomarina seosinensis]|uniref:3-methyladenine DNA glycosylase n=1 Tax=Idiomarina seosinensis TaxID=281739 RepID=A0A432ZHI8_9GAMM|nr:3-methyladenine DNA glycosylase [Idiomarina seosinensis]RUO77487.1 3-methyladenine DNA glycosylase [Idiomarina seosinensis]
MGAAANPKTAASIQQHLIDTQPGLELLMLEVEKQPVLTRSEVHPVEALPRIVIRQMLSLAASRTIIERAEAKAKQQNCRLAQLRRDDLLECGISKSKAATIGSIESYYQSSPEQMLGWAELPTERLLKEVTSIKGIGPWSAGILAMFHYAHEDLFPTQDSSLRKAIALLADRDINIIPERASPYRSYLACYLWQFLDQKRI